MTLKDVQEYLKLAEETILPDAIGDDIEVAFEVCSEAGKPRYVCFNVCTVYIESRLVVFSLEGSVVEIYHTKIGEQK